MYSRKRLALAIVALLASTTLQAAPPAATIEDSGHIASFDDVYQKQRPAPKPALPPVHKAPAAPKVVAAPVVVPTSPEPDAPQIVRYIPAPVVTLESGAVPVQRAVQPPVVSLPPAGN